MPGKVVDKMKTVDEVVEKVEKSVVESKPVEAVPDKVADKFDTVKVVNKKPKEEGPWNRLVQSDSLREPDENDERTPETNPKKESLEPAPALATKSLYVPPHLRNVSKPKKPLVMTMADRPFEKISVDYC